MLCYGPLVSVGGCRVHGAPNPVIGVGGGTMTGFDSVAYL